MKADELKTLEKEHIMQTYQRFDIIFERGEGCYIYDKQGKKYLDFFGGVATCAVGHANKEIAQVISDQAHKLLSVSNYYYTEPQILLAKKLSELSGLQKCFFCLSGTESNEAAIKLAKKVTGKSEFIAFKGSFHGRTTGSLALTWNPKYREPFLPLSPSVKFAEYNDLASARELINTNTAAIFVEPLQGEAGIVTPKPGFLRGIRKLCDDAQILMIVDEVQTGVGRTGKFFAYQHEGILPDIVTTAKSLANGIPIGVCLSNFEFEHGDHGTTLGGNNLSAAAALATIEYIEEHDLQNNAFTVGDYLVKQLMEMDQGQQIDRVRGKGLILGIVLKNENSADIVGSALKAGLIVNSPAPNIIRMLPPLTITKQQADECVSILKKVMQL